MKDAELTKALRKVVETMRQGEKNSTTIKAGYIKENDEELIARLGDKYEAEKDLVVDCELVALIKVEQWYDDGTVKRILRKGKGRSPNLESTVWGKSISYFLNCFSPSQS